MFLRAYLTIRENFNAEIYRESKPSKITILDCNSSHADFVGVFLNTAWGFLSIKLKQCWKIHIQ